MSGDASGVEFDTVGQGLPERLADERRLIDHRQENAAILESVLRKPNDPFDWVLKREPFKESRVRGWERVIDTEVTPPMALGTVCRVDTEGKFTNLEANVLYGLLEARDRVLQMPQEQRQGAVSTLASALGISGGYIEPKALQESIQRLSDLIKASIPFHGGFGDGALYIMKGALLGQKGGNEPGLVRQDAIDISDGKIRFNFARKKEFYNPATGETKIRPEFKTITYIGDRGVIVFDPDTGRVSDIMRPEVFARETEKTGGFLPLDMINARHTLREGNPLIMAMVKDALRATTAMFDSARPSPGVDEAEIPILLGTQRQILEEKLEAMQ